MAKVTIVLAAWPFLGAAFGKCLILKSLLNSCAPLQASLAKTSLSQKGVEMQPLEVLNTVLPQALKLDAANEQFPRRVLMVRVPVPYANEAFALMQGRCDMS